MTTFSPASAPDPLASDVTVVVPIRNEAATCRAFLAALASETNAAGEIVLVDAGSTDDTPGMLEQFARNRAGATVLRIGAAYPGAARNAGIRAAARPWIALTDAGTIARAGWFEALLAAGAGGADVVFGTYEPKVDTFFQACVALSFVPPGHIVDGLPVRGPSTASMMIRKTVWEALGGFREDLRACEDLEFFRALSEGTYHAVWAPRAIVEWRTPSTPAQLFRRFRVYSQHTLKARLGRDWHAGVLRMYAAAALFFFVASLVHWGFALVPIAGLIARAIRSVRRRRHVVPGTSTITARSYAAVAFLILWIDAAAFAGACDYLFGRETT